MILFIEFNISFVIIACIYAYFEEPGYYFARTKVFVRNPVEFTKACFFTVCDNMKSRYSKALLLTWIKNRTKPLIGPYVLALFVFYAVLSPEFRISIIELLIGLGQIIEDTNRAIRADYKIAFILAFILGFFFWHFRKSSFFMVLTVCICVVVLSGCNRDDEVDAELTPDEQNQQRIEKIIANENAEGEEGEGAELRWILTKCSEQQNIVTEIEQRCNVSIDEYLKMLDKRTYNDGDKLYYQGEERGKIIGKYEMCRQILSDIKDFNMAVR